MASTLLNFRIMLAVLGASCALAVSLSLAGCGGNEFGSDAAGQLAANQTAGSCDAPGLSNPGTVTPDGAELLKGVATLTAQPSPGAPEGKASSRDSKELIAAARNFVNCWNSRQYEKVIGLISVDFMKSYLVLENPADALIVLGGLPNLTYTVRSLGDARTHDDGRASVAIEYTAVHQQKVGRWYFKKDDGRWILDQEALLSFDLGMETATAPIEMNDFSYTPATTEIAQKPVIKLDVTNKGALPHEVVLVRVAPGTDPTTLLQPGVRPEGVEFFGQTMAVPGQKREVLVTGMAPGQYVMVCQLRFPKGPLHSAQGMVGLLTIR